MFRCFQPPAEQAGCDSAYGCTENDNQKRDNDLVEFDNGIAAAEKLHGPYLVEINVREVHILFLLKDKNGYFDSLARSVVSGTPLIPIQVPAF